MAVGSNRHNFLIKLYEEQHGKTLGKVGRARIRRMGAGMLDSEIQKQIDGNKIVNELGMQSGDFLIEKT